jgi:Asp-tRNA(Asn)/Glu-tRNA(Gln) amidotransferase A subunit family amidase
VGNMLGLCALTVPCGFTSQGLPALVQLNGNVFAF